MATEPLDWNAKYDCRGMLYGHQPNEFLAAHAAELFAPRARVLSLGEGEGRNAVWMGRHGWRVLAVDIAASALAKLAHLAAEAGVRVDTRRADAADFDAGEACFDAVVALHMHLPAQARRRAHRRAVRALKPGGVLIFEALRPEQLVQASSGPSSPEFLYAPWQLCQDFYQLQIKRLTSDDRDIRAGQHQGLTSVVSMIARRPG